MIVRRNRFHGQAALRAVYRNGQIIRRSGLSLKYIQRPAGRNYRLAVVVSRKVHKSAVRRNRIRRRLYEAVRLRQADFSGSYDLVLTVFSDELADLEPTQLTAVVEEMLTKAAITRTQQTHR